VGALASGGGRRLRRAGRSARSRVRAADRAPATGRRDAAARSGSRHAEVELPAQLRHVRRLTQRLRRDGDPRRVHLQERRRHPAHQQGRPDPLLLLHQGQALEDLRRGSAQGRWAARRHVSEGRGGSQRRHRGARPRSRGRPGASDRRTSAPSIDRASTSSGSSWKTATRSPSSPRCAPTSPPTRSRSILRSPPSPRAASATRTRPTARPTRAPPRKGTEPSDDDPRLGCARV